MQAQLRSARVQLLVLQDVVEREIEERERSERAQAVGERVKAGPPQLALVQAQVAQVAQTGERQQRGGALKGVAREVEVAERGQARQRREAGRCAGCRGVERALREAEARELGERDACSAELRADDAGRLLACRRTGVLGYGQLVLVKHQGAQLVQAGQRCSQVVRERSSTV